MKHDPAFPCSITEMVNSARQMGREPQTTHYKGLTKREYFAALAMQGFCKTWPAKDAARYAVQYADALIEELEK